MIPFLGCSTLQGAGVSSLGYLLGCNRKADTCSFGADKGSRGGCRTGAVNVFCSLHISGLESQAPTGAEAYAAKFCIQNAKLFRFWS